MERRVSNDPGPEGGDHPWRMDRRALRGVGMSVVVHPGRLRQELARRGWAARDLAREARLSEATVSTALAGRPIAARSLALITEALVRAPILPAVDGLLMIARTSTSAEPHSRTTTGSDPWLCP
jgi:lambda repressor-like predicted transcriptional regulator